MSVQFDCQTFIFHLFFTFFGVQCHQIRQALARGLNDALPRAAANRETRLEALALEDCQVGQEGAKARGFQPGGVEVDVGIIVEILVNITCKMWDLCWRKSL